MTSHHQAMQKNKQILKAPNSLPFFFGIASQKFNDRHCNTSLVCQKFLKNPRTFKKGKGSPSSFFTLTGGTGLRRSRLIPNTSSEIDKVVSELQINRNQTFGSTGEMKSLDNIKMCDSKILCAKRLSNIGVIAITMSVLV